MKHNLSTEKTTVNKKKRFNFKDDFEMLYLRHEYIKRIDKLDDSFVKKYAGIVTSTSKIMFDRLTNFEKVGFTIEDVVAISNIYMLSYMALYSILVNPVEMENFLKKKNLHSIPKEEAIRIDRNRLISFLRQRLHHCGTLCARKARNITVGADKRGIFAETKNSINIAREQILEDYQKYGYRKATSKEYKEALAKAKAIGKTELFDRFGFKIFKIEKLNDGIKEEDYRVLVEANNSMFYHAPDVALQLKEDEMVMEGYKKRFDLMTVEQRNKTLARFVRRNKGDKTLKKELRLARKMLNDNETVV